MTSFLISPAKPLLARDNVECLQRLRVESHSNCRERSPFKCMPDLRLYGSAAETQTAEPMVFVRVVGGSIKLKKI